MLVYAAALGAALFAHSGDQPPGKSIDLGGWSLYLNCSGRGTPTVIVETGFDEFASDWSLVQPLVAKRTRICTYDRAGYGFSDAGPMPRTLDQISLDLHRALVKAGEHGPYVMVGHSFGGPAVRNYARRYPRDVAGVALVEATPENHSIVMGGKAVKISSFATDKPIPEPSSAPVRKVSAFLPIDEAKSSEPDPELQPLSPNAQRWHAWAARQPKFKESSNSEREWSPAYLREMLNHPQDGSLGSRPLVVLTRAESGYEDLDDALASQMEADRAANQRTLVSLSSSGKQIILSGGHNLHLTAPDAVAAAILDVVDQIQARPAGQAK